MHLATACWCVQILQRLPELQQLDGAAVTVEERAKATESLRREAVVLALMASSACLAHKLVGRDFQKVFGTCLPRKLGGRVFPRVERVELMGEPTWIACSAKLRIDLYRRAFLLREHTRHQLVTVRTFRKRSGLCLCAYPIISASSCQNSLE